MTTTKSHDTWADRTLGDLVTEDPSRARVLESFGLDYCCGGGAAFDEACTTIGVDLAEVVAAFSPVEDTTAPDWASMPPAELVDHIESTHHEYLHSELPRLVALADKVAGVHGERHPELVVVFAGVVELRDDLEPHLMKEEQILFPAIRQHVPGDRLAAPISVMLAEHDATGEILERLRATALDYVVPDDACGSYKALYDGLAEMEADTHLHIHKENNVLFPAVLASAG